MRTPARAPDTGNALRLSEIVKRLGGTLRGSPGTLVRRVASLQSAGPEDITFLNDMRYRSQLEATRAGAVILPKSPQIAKTIPASLPSIECDDSYLYFAEVARLLSPGRIAVPGQHAAAVIEVDAKVSQAAQVGAGAYIGHRARIGAGAVIGPGCSVGDDAVIGRDSRLHANVTIYAACLIGQRAIIHSGAVIGADGFGMALKQGRWLKIPQTGAVVIGDDVEVGANTAIDRGALDNTVIERGVKLDNLIQVGHNVRIGAHTAIAGCVGIAGSARIGKHCTIGGGAIVLGHLEIADHVDISAATLVTKSILAAGKYTGAYPFDEHQKWGRSAVAIRHLGELVLRVRELERLIKAVTPDSAAPRPVRKKAANTPRLRVGSGTVKAAKGA